MASGASPGRSGSIWRVKLSAVPRPQRNGISASCVALPAKQSSAWRTALDFLADRFPAVSRDAWAARMCRGEVSNESGDRITEETRFTPCQKIFYFRSVADEPPIPFEETIVFQDEHILVADKPHFLPVVPAGRFVQETLLVRLKRRLGIDTLSPAHRIDRDTAGLVLFTIDHCARDAYQRMFRERVVTKRYEAIAPVNGNCAVPVMRRSRLIESAAFMQMCEVPGEPNAETHIALVEILGALARYELRPVTGQKHQLRAHMAALGIPILNDRIYPTLLANESVDCFVKPLQLLARDIAFVDPISGQQRQFSSRQRLTALDTDHP